MKQKKKRKFFNGDQKTTVAALVSQKSLQVIDLYGAPGVQLR